MSPTFILCFSTFAGLNKEISKLAKVESMKDMGFRDKFLYGRTFNAIDRLGLHESHSNTLKQSIISKQYESTAEISKVLESDAWTKQARKKIVNFRNKGRLKETLKKNKSHSS